MTTYRIRKIITEQHFPDQRAIQGLLPVVAVERSANEQIVSTAETLLYTKQLFRAPVQILYWISALCKSIGEGKYAVEPVSET
jgi:hypothetical protein